ncbi:MAG: formylglycine-generating enzyme family protein, partial [Synechococcales cyanobacterium]
MISASGARIPQAQYEAVMGINPNRRMATIWNGSQWIIDHPIPVQFDGMNKPAIAISFEDTQEFIRKLNQITGKQYRLPSEAEWEFVARAGTTTDYCYGDIITHQLVNFDGTTSPHQPSRAACPNGTLDVNQLYPNPWGLYHIHGNVWEWVEDYWHKNYSGAPTDGSAWIRDGVSEQRVVRGGSWANRYDRARSSYRSLDSSISHFNSNGFRIALSNLWSSTPIIQAGNSSPSIPMPVGNVSPTPKQTSSKQSTSSVSLAPYECITAQVDDRGNVTTYSVKPPGGKYVEQGLKLPSGALPLEMVVIPAG